MTVLILIILGWGLLWQMSKGRARWSGWMWTFKEPHMHINPYTVLYWWGKEAWNVSFSHRILKMVIPSLQRWHTHSSENRNTKLTAREVWKEGYIFSITFHYCYMALTMGRSLNPFLHHSNVRKSENHSVESYVAKASTLNILSLRTI